MSGAPPKNTKGRLGEAEDEDRGLGRQVEEIGITQAESTPLGGGGLKDETTPHEGGAERTPPGEAGSTPPGRGDGTIPPGGGVGTTPREREAGTTLRGKEAEATLPEETATGGGETVPRSPGVDGTGKRLPREGAGSGRSVHRRVDADSVPEMAPRSRDVSGLRGTKGTEGAGRARLPPSRRTSPTNGV